MSEGFSPVAQLQGDVKGSVVLVEVVHAAVESTKLSLDVGTTYPIRTSRFGQWEVLPFCTST